MPLSLECTHVTWLQFSREFANVQKGFFECRHSNDEIWMSRRRLAGRDSRASRDANVRENATGNSEFRQGKQSSLNLVKVRGTRSSQRDKFIEVDNCIVPGTVQEHIRLLGRRDFGISLLAGRLPVDVVSCRRESLARKNRFGYWNNALLSFLRTLNLTRPCLIESVVGRYCQLGRLRFVIKMWVERYNDRMTHPLLKYLAIT